MKRLFLLVIIIMGTIVSHGQKQANEFKDLEEIKAAANKGDTDAQNLLGYYYLTGTEGVSANSEMAFYLFMQSANQGNAIGEYYVGMCYLYGNGTKKDNQKAFEYIKKSAIQGNDDAQYSLGVAYEYGTGTSVDEKLAFEWYQKSAEQENPRGMFRIGHAYLFGWMTEADREKALDYLFKSASKGDDEAQAYLGASFIVGDFTEVDYNKAFYWLSTSVSINKNSRMALFYLGLCYRYGFGVAKNEQQAFEYIKNAAELEYPLAQSNLSIYYYTGFDEMKSSPSLAFEWASKAAAQNDKEGIHLLGIYHKEGVGTDKNEKLAYEYFTKAAEMGYKAAMYQLGLWHSENGVNPDKKEFFYWMMKAAVNGHSSAQYSVAYCYAHGNGVKQDYVVAVKWYREAMDNGNALAYNNMAYLYMAGKGVEKSVDKAFEMIDIAISLEPENVNYYDTKGELYSMIGDKNGAFEMWEKILSINPDFSEDTPFVQYIKANKEGWNEYVTTTSKKDHEIFEMADEMPEYHGGINGLMTYLSENIKYPTKAYQEGREGRVLVQFVINRDGSVVEAKVVNSVYSDLDEEALRVVNSMPKWKPGKHKGKYVRVKYTLPINFKIPNEE